MLPTFSLGGLQTSGEVYQAWGRGGTRRDAQFQRLIPYELLQGLAAFCLSMDEPALAILLILGFRCFLRTNEMLHLQCNHLLIMPGQQCINLVLLFSTTFQGNPQVSARFAGGGSIGSAAFARLPSGSRLPGHVMAFFTAAPPPDVETTFALLGLFCRFFFALRHTPRWRYVFFFFTCGNMGTTVARGRWSNSRVAKLYIDDGALALAEMRWAQPQQRAVRRWAKRRQRFYTPLRKVRGK